MILVRSSLRFLLALIIMSSAAQQLLTAQDIPVGTTRNGTFIWDGAQWIPAEEYAQPEQAPSDQVVYADVAPPPLPVYEQPPCPEPNLMWTPGYWAWAPVGYYWVPGAWVPAPYVGALWTPSYWGWDGGRFAYHGGYWGPHIGFYGGVNYGGGYMGIGFAGGTWNGGVFAYNTAVVRVNTSVVTNVYVNTTIVEQTTIINNTRVSYNGGPNGIQHQPAPEEQIAAHDSHQAPTKFQQQTFTAAKADKNNFAANNGGHPANVALAKPLAAERHAPPAGFKPPPERPAAQLAKIQAPPATVAAVKTATTQTEAVAKPEARPAPPQPARPAATPETRPAPVQPARPVATPEAKPVPEPPARTEPRTSPEPETRPAPEPKPEARPTTPAPKPEARPAPAPKPETRPAPEPKPAAKPAPKPAPKPKEEEKPKS